MPSTFSVFQLTMFLLKDSSTFLNCILMITCQSYQNRHQSFVENILHSGKTNTRTTEAASEVQEERMKKYAQMLTTDLLQEARKNLNKIGENCTQGPLTAKDVYPKAWVEKKVNNDLPETIQSLTADGHNLKLQLKASAKGTSALEGQRSFSPTVFEGLTSTPDGQVPKLMQPTALQEWNYGEELRIYDLPRECQLCLQNLPNVFQPPTTHLSTSHMYVHVTLLPAHEE